MKIRAQFLSTLQVEQIDEKNWRLLNPLRYYSAILDREVVVPAGFVSDFASVPRLPFLYWLAAGKFQAAAVLHDWFYRTDTEDITRATADALLAEAMQALGYWKIRAWFVWLGVRLGGYWSYDTRSTRSTAVQPATL